MKEKILYSNFQPLHFHEIFQSMKIEQKIHYTESQIDHKFNHKKWPPTHFAWNDIGKLRKLFPAITKKQSRVNVRVDELHDIRTSFQICK